MWMKLLAVALIALAIPMERADGQAQTDVEEPDLLLSIDVGYTTSYRDNSWVPVDVLVVNEQEDLTGWVEVRVIGADGDPESPIYRLPAVCPKNSKKRFRFNCFINGASRIEALIYERNRLAVEFPSYIQNPTPVRKTDLMGLILSDDAMPFGFLIEVANRVENKLMLPDSVDGIRFHRHALATDSLVLLPDITEAYKAFDVIIMGDFDPDRVGLRSRELIRNYVMGGGTLVVLTGINAPAYRGSWVEALMGVRLGAAENTNELAVAEAVFPPGQRQGARDDKECVLVTLEPDGPGVKRFGEQQTLATVNPLGQGVVCTIAVDAKSQVLQGTEGFTAMWAQVLMAGRDRKALNVDRVGQLTAQQLPQVLGVQIRPLSAVLAYLFLYLGLGVVGNWLFWNWLKRREMAWVSLVVISFCFTGYAMFSGTSGWEKSVDLQRIELVQLVKDSAIVDYDSFTGLLTSRTSTFSGDLVEEGLLIRDVNQLVNPYGGFRRGGMSAGRRPPFFAIQGAESGVENFRVGARELRLTHVEGQIRLPGGVDGTITIDSDAVHGRLRNYTGLTLREAKLFLDGVFFDLTPEGDGWSIRIPTDRYELRRRAGEEPGNNPNQNIYYSGQRVQIGGFMNSARQALFSDDEIFDSFALDPGYGAYVVGFTNEGVASGFVPAGQVNERISETLVTAPVTVKRDLPSQGGVDQLFVRDQRGQWRRSRRQPGNDWLSVYQGGPGEVGRVAIRLTSELRNRPDTILELDLFVMEVANTSSVNPSPSQTQFYLSPVGETDRAWHDAHQAPQQGNPDGRSDYSKITYTVPDWREHINPSEPSTLVFSLNTTGEHVVGSSPPAGARATRPAASARPGRPAGGRRGSTLTDVLYQISARAIASGEYTDEGGWQGWR